MSDHDQVKMPAGTPIPAPMPGIIVSFEKSVGDAVEQGETVLILESMKMENPRSGPASGNVTAINFDPGDSVATGDLLAVIE